MRTTSAGRRTGYCLGLILSALSTAGILPQSCVAQIGRVLYSFTGLSDGGYLMPGSSPTGAATYMGPRYSMGTVLADSPTPAAGLFLN